jgi:hypothetical protein
MDCPPAAIERVSINRKASDLKRELRKYFFMGSGVKVNGKDRGIYDGGISCKTLNPQFGCLYGLTL